MARTLAPATPEQVYAARRALVLLREARDFLRIAESPNALAATNTAIKSADGALRHIERRARAS